MSGFLKKQSWSNEGTVRHRQSKEASILWPHHDETRELPEKEMMQGTMPGACRRGRPLWPGWTTSRRGQNSPAEESIRMTEDSDKWRKYVHGVANPRIEDVAKEQIRTQPNNVPSRSSGVWATCRLGDRCLVKRP